MKIMNFKLIVILIIIFHIDVIYARNINSESNKYQLSDNKKLEIENFIKRNMEDGRIPGVSVVIVKNDETIYQKGFGYADIENQVPVTEDTLFELGSTSKAFTGLGILYLAEKGLLSLDDPISKYLPWFKATYKGKTVEIKLKHFLYQSSEIPSNSIGNIPISNNRNALEETIKTLIGMELDHFPGENFSYVTINYDVLGLVIEKVTGLSFEEFMDKIVLKPLKLNNTYVNRELAYSNNNMSSGYKLNYLSVKKYDAPTYRGNTPAGYFITNINDIAQWMKIQYGIINLPEQWQSIIKKSHLPDRTVLPSFDGSSYSAGWEVLPKGTGEIRHGGGNPNFSSYIIIKPEEKIGAAILANIGSDYTNTIGQGIMDILYNQKPIEAKGDLYKDLNNAASTIMIISGLFSIVTMIFIFFVIYDFIKRQRMLSTFRLKYLLSILFSFIFIACIGYSLYLIPDVLFGKLPWSFVKVWAPFSLIPSIISLFITIIILSTYFQLIFYFQKKNEKPIFPLIILSFISGFGNAFIIFTIIEALKRIREIEIGLVLYFIIGIVLYVIGQKLIRTKMVTITNNLIYEKRIELIDKILRTSYYKFEKLEEGKIHAGLNNDTEKVSTAPDVIIGGLTAIITLICCFIYLGIINIFGLFISIIVIFLATGLYFIVGRSANILLEQTRDIQNIFFRFINDLIGGFKELRLNFLKRNDFMNDMEKSCDEYRKKNIKALIKFANVFVIGELVFTLVIGTVAFIFPYIFDNIQVETLSTFIFIFLYMTGPVNGVLFTIPQLFQIRISWNRINDFIKEVSQISSIEQKDFQKVISNGNVILKLENVEYEYRSEDKIFKVGPINYEFKSGEIVFITGGNGSGKTTLAKLITGLYKPDTGTIKINGKNMEHVQLGEYYSNVFSDFYLFKKLYGINYKNKKNMIDEKLHSLQIRDKVEVKNGEFTTLNLSNGQRKRIALLVSYIEDKELFIFDEWAADQDPEFRKYFYNVLIQDLKKKNKCVIAITHDDHYFHFADKVIKMDMGKMEN